MTSKMTDELLPCPFCGSDKLHIEEGPLYDRSIMWYEVLHHESQPCGASLADANRNEVIRKWNTRISHQSKIDVDLNTIDKLVKLHAMQEARNRDYEFQRDYEIYRESIEISWRESIGYTTEQLTKK